MKSTPEDSEYVPKKTRTLLPSESSACPTDTAGSLTQNTQTARRQSLMGHTSSVLHQGIQSRVEAGPQDAFDETLE